MWLRAIASTTHGARDDAQVPPQEDADDRAGLGFRPAARYTACTGFCSALTAPMFGRPGGSPVFLVSEHELAGGPLADSEHVRRGGTPSGQVTRSPRSGRGRADLRSRPSDRRWSTRRCPAICGCPANEPNRSQIGASSAWQSSSRPVHRSTSTSSSPSRRLSTILSARPPRPARPLNGTTATVAPRFSSSSQTAVADRSSRPPGRSRASCVRDASRPDGVRHGSPAGVLHVGHGRARHPRAMWSRVSVRVLLKDDVLQRAPGAARHVGHQLLEPQGAVAHDPLRTPSTEAATVAASSSAAEPMWLGSAAIGRTLRPAGGQPVRSEVSPGKSIPAASRASVHFPSIRSEPTGFRVPRTYTPNCSCLLGFRAHRRASLNARDALNLPR